MLRRIVRLRGGVDANVREIMIQVDTQPLSQGVLQRPSAAPSPLCRSEYVCG